MWSWGDQEDRGGGGVEDDHSSSPSSQSWTECKESGKRAFGEGRYSDALSHYSAALERFPRPVTDDADDAAGWVGVGSAGGVGAGGAERQILLSNLVACRLKIGGREMANRAVEEATECVACNDQWAKAHVRLASALVAAGGRSNDACVSLQRALAIDPGNAVARSMLVGELRRRDGSVRGGGEGGAAMTGGAGRTAASPEYPTPPTDGRHRSAAPSAPPAEDILGGGGGDEHQRRRNMGEDPPHADGASGSNRNGGGAGGGDRNPYENLDADDDVGGVDDSPTFARHLSFRFARLAAAYETLSDDLKSLVKVFVCLVVIYVGFGGRFGLDYALGGAGGGGARARADLQHRRASSTSFGPSGSGSSGYNDRTNPDNARRYGGDRSDSGGAWDSTAHRGGTGSDSPHDQDEYRRRDEYHYDRHETTTRRSGGGARDDNRRRNRYDDDGGGRRERYDSPPRSRRGSSYHLPNLFDGSLAAMAILLVVGAACHRLGVNPLQVFMMINMMQGGGRRGRMGMGGMLGGGGMGMGRGYGGGMGMGRRYRFGGGRGF